MLKTSYSDYVEANHTYCLTISISIVSCRQKEFWLVVALSVRLLSLAPWSDTYPDGIAQPWIRCSNIEIGNGIEGDMLTRSRCRKRDSPTSLFTIEKTWWPNWRPKGHGFDPSYRPLWSVLTDSLLLVA